MNAEAIQRAVRRMAREIVDRLKGIRHMESLAIRYPFIFGILVSLAAVLGQMWALLLPGLSQSVQILFARATDLLIAVYLPTSFHWWREAGFVRITSWKILLPYLPLILVVLLVIVTVIGTTGMKVNDPTLFLLRAVSFLVGGFVEEALFRGIILRAFLPRRLLNAALLSSIVFSIAHLPNMLLGQDLGATGLQLVRTFLLGLVVCQRRLFWRESVPRARRPMSSFQAGSSLAASSSRLALTSPFHISHHQASVRSVEKLIAVPRN